MEGKGLDLVSAALENLLEYDAVQIVILGSGGEKEIKKIIIITWRGKYPEKFKVYLGYKSVLANEIYWGVMRFNAVAI